MKKTLLAVLLASATFVAQAAENLIIGTEATYAPFEFTNDKNEIVGFDIDIINKICSEMNVSCKIVNQSFDGLIPSLKTRRIDAAIAGIDVTAERQKQIDFTKIYYDDSSIQFITLKDTLTSLEQLKGKRVGIQKGTTYLKYLNEKFPDIKPVSYDSYQFAFLDLKAKRIDAIVASSFVASDWLGKDTEIVPLGDKITDHEFFGEGLSIALRKGNDELREKFNQAIDKLKANGELEAIYKKWFNN
ncbi:transporter substrate-binding domain-containing protein [Gilliamella sp. B2776]|uniref:transporter substrate-binding domain-containing protein n=1 Tax=unclassified Gilliamella TaxID=2685620 RepID=UPI002269CA75|nr:MULTISPECIES: transporter substrate-binding domain-containing protein [unclassified Gilliamella]MCX8650761.1 transporter substrate-binding domain-containing protein [Gilliamella sp. B2779]MCX8654079.1 transporter substrate-binding domain-containing protein [Gilliamella sp. B2737]MCX8665690.1 transporter substrate-binding domain-containing protein [Gilliamella sp. B2887]MCX8692609.1 transporter substrate-binding domain-containing protein [Gilliamella sp. B2776]MCX8698552.1 transporter substr